MPIEYISGDLFVNRRHAQAFAHVCLEHGLDPIQVQRETDPSPLMEGLYIKAEAGGVVTGRSKYIRAGFLQTVLDSESHWQDRPLLPNRLQAGVVVF